NPNSVNIARLRLWIELLKHTYYTDDSYINLEVLPNLEFKVMTANSLLKLQIPKEQADDLFFGQDKKQVLREKMREYYNATREEKQDIKNSVIELIEKHKKDTANPQLENYHPFDTVVSNGFFDSGLLFGIDGVDIVLMNPPYFALQSLAKKDNPYQGKIFDTYASTGDIYQLFLERVFDLIDEDGIVSAIVSNKWMRAGYGEGTREWLYQNAYTLEVLDLGSGWFESATVDTNIISYEKRHGRPHQDKIPAYTLNNKITSIALGKTETEQKTILPKPDGDSWIILNECEAGILEKMNAVGKPLKDWDITINYGIKTGFNEAFIIDADVRDLLIAEDSRSAEIIKPLLRGRDIKRYSYEFADKWLINTHNGVKSQNIDPIDINNYPAIKKHLDQYKEQLEKRQDKGTTPYNLRNCAYLEDFDKPKIVYPETTQSARFCYDDKGLYPDKTNYIITGKFLHYIQAILSSQIGYYLFYNFISTIKLGDDGYQYRKDGLEEFPIPVPTPEQETEITALVQTILDNKTHHIDTTEEERQIDLIVYQMYQLSEDEVALIEGRE
ncbi:MAG: Eco57I restriction-modification methylase domain-containing protein, partial [Brevinema sp.]